MNDNMCHTDDFQFVVCLSTRVCFTVKQTRRARGESRFKLRFFFFSFLSTYMKPHKYIVYVCVCVCVCLGVGGNLKLGLPFMLEFSL